MLNFLLENYDKITHPVQQSILKKIITEIVGCEASVFAIPLYNFALSYLKLVYL